MQPRVNDVRSCSGKHQSTPAPLLLTRHGQLPNLAVPLAERATPCGETLLLSLPLLDWERLVTESGRGAVDLPMPPGGVGELTGHAKALFVLSARAAGSRQTLCDAPGKSVNVRIDPAVNKGGVVPGAVARLHRMLQTDFAIAPTDAPYYGYGSWVVRKRRAVRSVEQCKAFVQACVTQEKLPAESLLVSVQGGIEQSESKNSHAGANTDKANVQMNNGGSNGHHAKNERERNGHRQQPATSDPAGGITMPHMENNHRTECAKTVSALPAAGGASIDGLYAGESPEERFGTIRRTVQALPAGPLRVLSGGSGGPWDVLRAVSLGIDVIDSSYPFDMAELGYATRLVQLHSDNPHDASLESAFEYVNVRSRKWETCTAPLVAVCECFVCKGYSRAYIRHLYEVHEMMGVSFVTAHNLWDYLTWFRLLREAIAADRFKQFVDTYEQRRRDPRTGPLRLGAAVNVNNAHRAEVTAKQ